MQLTVLPGGTFALQLSAPQEARIIEVAAAAKAKADADANILARTYHLGPEPTRGRGYDDRLVNRTGYSRSTLLSLLHHGVGRKSEFGVLVGICAANKWIVSEAAVRAWLGQSEDAV